MIDPLDTPDQVPLGQTGLDVSRIGFGAFKLGRNEGIKYPKGYELPDDRQTDELLNGILDLGINLIDTAPAYGISEERIGASLSHRRSEFVLSSKVGETFIDGRSTFDFSRDGIRTSVARSLDRLKTDSLELLLLHSNGDDHHILHETDAVSVLLDLRSEGIVNAIGLSGKTVQGAQNALDWADVLMIEYHVEDESHAGIMQAASQAGVGILIKKGLSSGHLPADDALRFVLGNAAVHSVVVGSLNLGHIAANVATARSVARSGQSFERGGYST